jgi:hypothetical protein
MGEVSNLPIVEAREPLPQPATELEVEQPATGRREDVGPPAEVDVSSTVVMNGDHVAGLKAECSLGGTWAERPR